MNKETEMQEEIITEMIANTFHFTKKAKGYVCNHCGIRFQIYAIGMPLNDRMIQHAERHGIGGKKG